MAKKQIKKRIASVGALALIMLLVAHHVIYFAPTYYEYCSSAIVYPVLIAQQKIIAPLKGYFQKKKNASELTIQLEALTNEIEDADAEIIRLKSQLAFARESAEVREFAQRYTQAPLIGQVMTKEFSEQEHSFLINIGEQQGIKQDAVVVYKDAIIGRIGTVFPWYSKVILITDRTCKIGAYCERTGATGIHEGINHEGSAYLNHVSHLHPISTGDLIISSGNGLVFPQGFALSKIVSCEQNSVCYDIKTEPIYDLSRISYCYVLQPAAPDTQNA